MIGTDSYHIVIEFPDLQDKEAILDYRYSQLEVQSINNTKKKKPFKMNSREPIKAKFLGEGIVRLYREFEDDSDSDDGPEEVKSTVVSNQGDDTMLSIISIPTYFTATDVLGFIGEKYMAYITHIRILKSEKPNRFLVLLKFNDLVKTAEFQYNFDGKPFNSMEPEACHVVYVKSVRIESPNSQDTKLVKSTNDALIPFLLNDPFTSPETKTSTDNTTLVELPTCPVCLERMDAEVTGLLTIPCQHTFHCQCLSKWKDDTCPICRYSNNVSNQKVRRSIRRLSQYSSARMQSVALPHSAAGGTSTTSESTTTGRSSLFDSVSEETETCAECSTIDNLWICLICGNIGCSRYAPEQHSLKHFVNTGHCFAMEMSTSRVWDYAGDNYVHRLITNQSDGKLVELPEKGSSSSDKPNSSIDKVDEVGFEYSQLLISQLASQQEYYEALLSEKNSGHAVGKSRRGSSITEIMNTKAITNLEIKVDELTEQLSQINLDVIPSLKDKIKLKDEKINRLSKDLNESKMFNETLSSKVEYLTSSKTELEAQNQDLNEQVKDLMFFLETQEKFKDEPQDVKDGTIVIQKDAKSKKGKKKR
ncbi:hypothetical protein CANTEDRAFT_100543 [Yamadazyma tenuis ATCC 10573]|uniref:Zf-UBP-domain-containing protein n=1 Tax=Candida tenuis (strain ATCC 10573 / BCRC 21748 / CBS 615 / JCM 9827 / NBRC 10315 / NRRL Y-1498 / VKM Y-70) TaxID=590646 RepID=G3AW11_CANTC|nr:uncharacterized protein CANTEDRAFT_100543 [Yamadazyma tenuis ATCC 10573]EGV66423.1 hypothetical protein CANTEDRAFT_100543 [Yamadazyma tenuis ATCC 10573]